MPSGETADGVWVCVSPRAQQELVARGWDVHQHAMLAAVPASR